MRRVLIVTSSYAPAMIADMHRARQLAWELPKYDWTVEILSPDESYQQSTCIEKDSGAFFAPDVPTHFVRQQFSKLFAALGMRSIGWRSFFPMWRAGAKLLAQRPFDLVYFSTTQFPLFLLGPIWRRRVPVPYVLDFHDPCYRDDSTKPVWARPTLKHALSRWLTKFIEARSSANSAGVVVVSPEYLETLRRRFMAQGPAWMGEGRQATIPFAALPQDFVASSKPGALRITGSEVPIRIVYVGVGGPIMIRAFALICRGLAHLRTQGSKIVERTRIELYGTMLGWRAGDPTHLADVASEQGVADLLREDPRRVSYRRSLELLQEGSGALILGVDDRGYMPSKLFSYALSGKPILASLRRDGPAFAQFQRTPELGHAIWFEGRRDIDIASAARMIEAFLQEVAAGRAVNRDVMLRPFLASAMAQRHAKLFEACLLEAK